MPSLPPLPPAAPGAAPSGGPRGDTSEACASPLLAELCACHERFDEMLELLRGLAPHLQRQGPDEQARRAAARVLAVLDGEMSGHRAHEEREVLPVLRRRGGAAGIALAARLETEHRLLARAWGQCRPALAALSNEGRWPGESAALEFERWRDFAALATAHMLAENGAAFPTALALMRAPPP